MDSGQTIGTHLWLVIISALISSFTVFTLVGFRLSPGFFAECVETAIVFALIARFAARMSIMERSANAADSVAQLAVIGLSGFLVAYAASAHCAPLVDAQLALVDRTLGYDWLSFARFCAAWPTLTTLFDFAYHTNMTQPLAIAIALCLSGNQSWYERFALATLLSAALTAFIFMLYPATTAWTHAGQEHLAASVHPFLPLSTRGWIRDLVTLRRGEGRYMTGASGIIAFPSYHCISGILNVWACWPLQKARFPVAALNLVMIVSALLCGGHYLADLIAGALTAWIALAASSQLHQWLGSPAPLWVFAGPRLASGVCQTADS